MTAEVVKQLVAKDFPYAVAVVEIRDNKLPPPVTDGRAVLLRGTVFHRNTKRLPTAAPLIRRRRKETESAYESAQHRAVDARH